MPLQNAFAGLATEPTLASIFGAVDQVEGKLDTILAGLKVHDDYQAGEVLADQTGAAAVLTFTFAAAVNLVVVDANGATTDIARADPFGATPTATQGIPCRDEVPTFMPVTTTVVKVYAPTGMVVSVYGYRRA